MSVSKWTYWTRMLLRPSQICNDGVWMDIGPLAFKKQARDFYADRHEAEERHVIRQRLRSTDIVLELGSGMGIVTTTCCQIAGSDSVFTFEANPKMEEVLRKNFDLNHVSPHLTMAMISAAEGTDEFHVSDKFLLSSRYESATRVSRAHVECTTVPTVSLQNVIKKVRPTFLVVDIEGGELELLNTSIDFSSVERMCIEFHPHIIGDAECGKIIDALVRQGFYVSVEWSTGPVLYLERSLPAVAAVSAVAA